MIREDDFQYALENTRVIRPPVQAIQTFGTTSFRFMLVTELMDQVNRVRVRDGRIHAERPSIVTPQHYSKMMLDGFGEEARGFADWLETHGRELRFLRLGLLQADHVRVLLLQPVQKTLVGGGADAIGVECQDAHEDERLGRGAESLAGSRTALRASR